MNTTKRKLLTVVTEAVIEEQIVSDLKKLGAHGYTIVEARGAGAHGVRGAEERFTSNIRVEIICDEVTADRIVIHFQKTYYDNYAMISYITDVDILRPNKF
jgi:nitrogen regulatory protein PII